MWLVRRNSISCLRVSSLQRNSRSTQNSLSRSVDQYSEIAPEQMSFLSQVHPSTAPHALTTLCPRSVTPSLKWYPLLASASATTSDSCLNGQGESHNSISRVGIRTASLTQLFFSWDQIVRRLLILSSYFLFAFQQTLCYTIANHFNSLFTKYL